MPYLICEKCGRNYELKKGESVYNVIFCECGGNLIFLQSLNEANVRQFKNFRDLLSYRNFFLLLFGLSCVFLVAIPSIINFENDTTYFENNWISFNYPTGWNLEENNFNEFNVSVTGISNYNYFYIDKRRKSYSDDSVLNNLLNSGLNHETLMIDGIIAHKFIKSYDKYGNAEIILYIVKDNLIYDLKFSGNSRDVDEALNVVIKSLHAK